MWTNKEAEDEVADLNMATSKRAKVPDISSKTRQSSRLQDADVYIQEKAIAKKANAKGISSSSLPPPSNSSCSLESLARVCGFSLGC